MDYNMRVLGFVSLGNLSNMLFWQRKYITDCCWKCRGRSINRPQRMAISSYRISKIIALIYFQEFKRARRMFKEMNCDNLKETSQKMIVDTFAPSSLGNDGNPNRRSRRRSRTRRDRKRKPVSIWDGIIS